MEGECYTTKVYCYEGWLWELFAAEGGTFSPEDGERLLEAEDLVVSLDNNILSAEICFTDGSSRQLFLYVRNGEGAAP